MNNDRVLPTKYVLEIYEANSARDVWISFSSNTPFLSISKGDIINPAFWPTSQSPMRVLKVLSVEHIVWEDSAHVIHKICVFTKEVDGTEKLRLNGLELSEKDRLMIINQLKILAKLYPEEADYYLTRLKAIQEGYKLHYSWLTEWLYDEMPEAECKEVLDILEMYRGITFSYEKLKDKTGIAKESVKFRGFDGNEEGRQFSYTLYFIVDLKRYDELRYEAEYPDFNSHCPMLYKYRRMLSLWKTYPNQFALTREQIQELLDAK